MYMLDMQLLAAQDALKVNTRQFSDYEATISKNPLLYSFLI